MDERHRLVLDALASRYPSGTTASDVYGSGIEGLLANENIPANVRQILADTTMAGHHSALVGRGFDPRRIGFAENMKDEGGNSVVGQYNYDNDVIFADPSTPSAPSHESIHRALGMFYPQDAERGLPYDREEALVRSHMFDKYGNVEMNEDFPKEMKSTAMRGVPNDLRAFYGMDTSEDDRMLLKALEGLAARDVARRRPGGPR